MLKKLNTFLNILMGSFVGVWCGSSLYKLWDYKSRPELYAVQSAPWYLGIQLFGGLVLILLGLCLLGKLLIRRKLRHRKDAAKNNDGPADPQCH